MNRENATKTYELILANKENWSQDVWHGLNPNDPKQHECLTQHCVAGFAQMLLHGVEGMKVTKERLGAWDPPGVEATRYLDLSWQEASYLFYRQRTWPEVEVVLRDGKFPWGEDDQT